MKHISFSRLALTLVGVAVPTFCAAFARELQIHPVAPDATAGAMLASWSVSATQAAQAVVIAVVLALLPAFTRLDAGTTANGLRSPEDTPDESTTVPAKASSLSTSDLAAAIEALRAAGKL